MPDWPVDTLSGLVKPAIAEFIAMTLFTYCGIATAMTSVGAWFELPDVRIPLSFGFSIFVLAYTFGKISGGHINPAVTLAMLLVAKISPLRAFVYLCAQMAGAFTSALLLGLTFGTLEHSHFGVTDFELGKLPNTPTGRAFFVEFILTFLLLLVVNLAGDTNGKRSIMAPLAVGTSVAVAHLVAVPITGCGINPARSFASCVAADLFGTSYWNNHWLYWIAPILGGCTSTIIHQIFFIKQRATVTARPASNSALA